MSDFTTSENVIGEVNFSFWAPDSVEISPDNRRMAYTSCEGTHYRVIVDGEAGDLYAAIGEKSFIFSPDSRRLAYAAKRDGKWFVILDGEEGPLFDDVGMGSLVFSPDSQHLAYEAAIGNVEEGGKRLVVLNGVEQEKYGGILVGSLVFSPDSQRLAYAAKHHYDEGMFAVVDGGEGKSYAGIRGASLCFSPDSQRFAYLAQGGGKQFVVIDGHKRWPYDCIFVTETQGLVFSSSQQCHFLALRDNHILLVEERDRSA